LLFGFAQEMALMLKAIHYLNRVRWSVPKEVVFHLSTVSCQECPFDVDDILFKGDKMPQKRHEKLMNAEGVGVGEQNY
jgi:C4-type Zn-finger protein